MLIWLVYQNEISRETIFLIYYSSVHFWEYNIAHFPYLLTLIYWNVQFCKNNNYNTRSSILIGQIINDEKLPNVLEIIISLTAIAV